MKKPLVRILKLTGKILLSVIGLIVLWAGIVYCLSRITVNRESGTKDEVVIYIRTNGVHTDIVVPVKTDEIDWSREVAYQNTSAGDTNCNYVGMGWGDKGFYLETPEWKDLKFSVAFKAMFALSTTAIHATFYRQLSEGKTCKRLVISRTQYARLVRFIQDSFQRDANGHFINIKTHANYGADDAFYEAKGKYNLFYTCNTWANNALKSAGQKCALWTIFDTGIFSKYN